MIGATLCSGIGAPECAAPWIDWRWHAEIEAFPAAVHAVRFPGSVNLGDMTSPDLVERAAGIALPDIIVAGTPCQAFSVAGTRGSLADARGNLTLLFVRICNAIDDLRRAAGLAPLWIVWENVPGVFSTADNAFGSFVAGMVGGDAALEPPRGRGWTDAGVVSGPERCAAWRVLDAQHFGLAQRRRRVFVVARGGSGSWAGADALLPVVESVHWHPAPRRGAGQRTARPIAAGSPGGSGYRNDADAADNLIAGTVRALNGCKTASGRHDVSVDTFVAHSLRADGFDASEDGTGRGAPLVPVAFAQNQIGEVRCSGVVGTLNTNSNASGRNTPLVAHAFDARQSDVLQYGDRAGPLDTDGHSQAIAFSAKDHGADAGEIAPTLRSMGFDGSHANGGGQIAVALHENQRAELSMSDTAGALKSGGGKPGQGYAATLQAAAVRRLTPRECERLQGFPDDWTLIPISRASQIEGLPPIVKMAADGPRYKALGNSMAVPVMRYLLQRITDVENGR